MTCDPFIVYCLSRRRSWSVEGLFWGQLRPLVLTSQPALGLGPPASGCTAPAAGGTSPACSAACLPVTFDSECGLKHFALSGPGSSQTEAAGARLPDSLLTFCPFFCCSNFDSLRKEDVFENNKLVKHDVHPASGRRHRAPAHNVQQQAP